METLHCRWCHNLIISVYNEAMAEALAQVAFMNMISEWKTGFLG
jgi:pyruvate-formate lyase-activating enzyme